MPHMRRRHSLHLASTVPHVRLTEEIQETYMKLVQPHIEVRAAIYAVVTDDNTPCCSVVHAQPCMHAEAAGWKIFSKLSESHATIRIYYKIDFR